MGTYVPDENLSRTKFIGCAVAALLALGVTVAMRYARTETPAPTRVVVNATPPAAPTQPNNTQPAEKAEPVPPPLPKSLNLIDKVNLDTGTVAGTWAVKDGTLVSDATPGAKLQIPIEGPDEYDVYCEFTRLSGNSTFNLLLSRRGVKFGFSIGWKNNSICNFFDVNAPGGNPTPRPFSIVNGQRYKVKVEVRNTGMKAYIDEKLMTEWATNYKDMSRWNGWDLKNNNYIGVGTWESPTVFHTLELVEITPASGKPKDTEF